MKLDKNIILLAVVAVVILGFVGKGIGDILESLGLKKSDDDKKREADVSELSKGDYWNPKYYKQKLSNVIKLVQAQKLAAILHAADGYFNDDENKVYGVFRALPTKAAVSFIAEQFFKKYDADLHGYLSAFMDEKELQKLYQIIQPLPSYKKD